MMLRLVTILHFVAALGYTVLVLFMLAGVFLMPLPRSAYFPLLLFALFTLTVGCALVLWCSWYATAQHSYRWLSLAASCLLLFWIPLGTLAGIFSLWVLTAPPIRAQYR